MNAKTFRFKEIVFFVIPVMIIDLLIHFSIYKWVSGVFRYWDPADIVMRSARTPYFLVVSYLLTVLVIVPIRLYQREVTQRTVMWRAFLQTGFTLSLFALSVFILFGNFAGKLLLQDAIAATIAIAVWHLIARLIINGIRKHGRNKVRVAIVGGGASAEALEKHLSSGRGYEDYLLVGKFDAAPAAIDFISSNVVHSVYCSLNPATCTDDVMSIIRTCENLFVDFYYLPNMEGYLRRQLSFSTLGDITAINLREEPLANPLNAMLKRLIDIFVSFLFLITLFPIISLFAAIGIKLSSPGPVFFIQKRTGYKGKEFRMFKFRSMRQNTDSDTLQATEDDPRKTKFGEFLRRTSIDELPQFINVFKGDMSLIGPRPHMIFHTETYNKLVDEYMVRHMVKPGLTGWAQINGCRGETRTPEQMAERVKHDIWYIENWSIWLDLKIFLLTIVQLVKGDEQAF